jgi:amino acid permease
MSSLSTSRLIWISAVVLLVLLTVLGVTVMAETPWWPYFVVIVTVVVIVVAAMVMRGKRGGPEASAPLGPVKGTESATTPPAIFVK